MPNKANSYRRGYGPKHQALRKAWAAQVQRGSIRCARCSKLIEPGQAWDLGHTDDRTGYVGPEHMTCNRRAGQNKSANNRRQASDLHKRRSFFPNGVRSETPAAFASLSLDQRAVPPPVAEQEIRPELVWNAEALFRYEWLAPFLDVPDNASPPLYMSPPPRDAVGSYGPGAIAWIEHTQRIQLRWWQELAIVRQLEHRADGSLCHRVIVESTPRRAGKSVRLRGLALWRMAHAELLGEVQTVVHTGSDVAICREVQRGAWRWSEEVEGWTVMRANGKECIETPEGDRWLVRSQSAVYGYDICLGLVDEGWNVAPDTVSEGMEPAMLERHSPQLHLTSTAHRRATSTMRTRLQNALTTPDDETLLLLWCAPTGADPADPQVWRAASPYWSEDRRRMIEAKYAAALAGESDPQADDPDPMAGFTAQYLNVWRVNGVEAKGDAVIAADEWANLTTEQPRGAPDVAAIESWFSDGVSLALAWRGSRAVVSVTDYPSLPDAIDAMRASGFRAVAIMGESLTDDPAAHGIRCRPVKGRTINAVQELQRVVGEDGFRHTGDEHLTKQILAARTLPGADGPRMASKERADAIKAAMWAVERCRSMKATGKPRIVTTRH